MLFHVTVPSRFSWTKVQVSRWSAGATRSKASPAPFSVSWDRRWASEVFKVAVGGNVSCRLLILQDGPLVPWWWESAPPLWGLTPLGGGGESVSGPAWRGSAVGWAGWSQEAGVQGWSHWRARQVLRHRDVRQTCFCSVIYIYIIALLQFSQTKRVKKATTGLNTPWLDRGHVTRAPRLTSCSTE